MLVEVCLTESFVNANQVHLFLTHTIPHNYGLLGRKGFQLQGIMRCASAIGLLCCTQLLLLLINESDFVQHLA